MPDTPHIKRFEERQGAFDDGVGNAKSDERVPEMLNDLASIIETELPKLQEQLDVLHRENFKAHKDIAELQELVERVDEMWAERQYLKERYGLTDTAPKED